MVGDVAPPEVGLSEVDFFVMTILVNLATWLPAIRKHRFYYLVFARRLIV